MVLGLHWSLYIKADGLGDVLYIVIYAGLLAMSIGTAGATLIWQIKGACYDN